MNFNQIIKEEWQQEFLDSLGQEPLNIENSIFIIYEDLVKRICTRVWNSALELAAEEVEVICDSSETFQAIDINSILKLKIDEQGTDTTEV